MKRSFRILTTLIVAVLAISACAPQATPTAAPEAPVQPTAVPATEVPPTEAPPTEEPPCLIVGATYGGPMMDAGYNQAMHEAVVAIQENISCVEIIEAENVYDEAGATSTIENMISQGAKLIFATAYAHQYPALEI